MTKRSESNGLRRRAIAGVLLLVAGVSTAIASSEVGGVSAAAATGALVVHPTSGDTDNTNEVTFTAPAPCGDGEDGFIIQATGAGLGDGTNLVGFTTVPGAVGEAISNYPMGNTFKNAVAPQGATFPLDGSMHVTLACIKTADQSSSTKFEADIQFTKPAPPGLNSTWAVVGGGGGDGTPTPTPSGGAPTPTPTPGSGTPTPTPAASATPTPSATPKPSTTPCPTATPAASPSPTATATATPAPTTAACPGTATPTPTPSSNASPTPTPSGTVAPSATPSSQLPATGASHARPLLAVAALMLVFGALLLVLSVPPAREEEL